MLIKEAKDNGEINPKVDPRQFLITLMGACTYFFIAEPIIKNLFVGPLEYDRDIFLEERKTAILNTLFFGIQSAGEK
jgi:hypothetical protein